MPSVFIAYQTPIADLRPFVPRATTRRLDLPHWASVPEGKVEFLRGVGALRRRRRGGVAAWTGESVFCDARRAVRFPPGKGPWDLRHAHGEPLGRLRLGWQFRRLYAGGVGALWPILRVDLGFRQTSDRDELRLSGEVLRRLPEVALRSHLEVRPARVPPRQDAWRATTLAAAGRPLAEVMLRATTEHAVAADADARWVLPGRGMMIVEHDAALPGGAVELPRSRRIASVAQPGLSLHHCQLDIGAYHPTVWFMGTTSHADQDTVRRLRLHLARIHTEHQCLKNVVAAVLDGKLADLDDDGLTALDDYLDRAGTRRLSSTRHGLPQDEILDVAYRTDAVVAEGELPTLLERLGAARASVRRKLEAIAM